MFQHIAKLFSYVSRREAKKRRAALIPAFLLSFNVRLVLSGGPRIYQAHLLVVIARSRPLPLSDRLWTLAYDLGCFPRDFGS